MVKRLGIVAILLALMGFPVRATISIPLVTKESIYPGSSTGIARTNEPVSVGIPFPDNDTEGGSGVGALSATGTSYGQFRVLGTWPSGRMKWVQFDTLVGSLSAGGENTGISITSGATGNFGASNMATDNGTTISVDTGAAQFTIKKANYNGFDIVVVGGTTVVATGTSDGFVVIGPSAGGSFPANVTCSPETGGATCNAEFKSSNDSGSTCGIEENGPVRVALECTYDFEDGSGNVYMHGTARMHFYQGKTYSKVVSVLRNADDGTSDTFARAYKGVDGYEMRVKANITTTSNTYTIANHTGTPTSGTLTGSDTAQIYQAKHSLMQGEGQYAGYPSYETTDTGYAIQKNGSDVQTGTATDRPEGWCDIANGSGVGIQVGIYQMAPSYPKGCGFTSAGQIVRVMMLPKENSVNHYIEWPSWNELTDVFVNFHTSNPSSLSNDFLKFQHYLISHADYAYYNSTLALPTQMISPTVEDTYVTDVVNAASPSISGGNKWATSNLTTASDFGTTVANFPLQIISRFAWDLEQEYRYGYLLTWIRRGWPGNYLQASHFSRHHLQYMLPHSDGFDWRTGHGAPGGATLNGFGQPETLVENAQNRTLGTHSNGASVYVNWRDQEHGFWFSMIHYYWMSGDEFVRDALVDQQKDWFVLANTYQDVGGFGSNQGDISGTSFFSDFGPFFTSQLIGQTLLFDTSKTPYEIVAVPTSSTLTLKTAAPSPLTNKPYIVVTGSNGLFNARSLASQFIGGVRFADFLRSIGDSDYATVLDNLQHLFDFQVRAKSCMSGYPSGCTFGDIGDPDTWKNLGINRERGAHWGASGSSGTWCGVAHRYRVNSIFQESMLAEGLLEMADYKTSSWADYYLARDLAFGISQWGLNEGWYGGSSDHSTSGFRFGEAFDVRNDCQESTDVWSVTLSGTSVTRVSGPNFDFDSGNWTSGYALIGSTSAFIVDGTARQIASVADADHLTLVSCPGCTGTVSAYWREENYDTPYENGAGTSVWNMAQAQSYVIGGTGWEAKFKLAMLRSMSVSGLAARDVLSYQIMRMIGEASTPRATLSNVTLTGFTDNGGGSYTLSWNPVSGASYRIKWGTKTLVDLIGFNGDTNVFTGDPTTTMNWWAAENVSSSPTCTSSCSITIATGQTGLTSGNFSVRSQSSSGGGNPAGGLLRLRRVGA